MARRRRQQSGSSEDGEGVALLDPTGADEAGQYDETAPLTSEDGRGGWEDVGRRQR